MRASLLHGRTAAAGGGPRTHPRVLPLTRPILCVGPPPARDYGTQTCLLLPTLHTPDCNVMACWGRGEDGQLGHGDAAQVDAPKAVAALAGKDVSAVVCGAEYTVAVSAQHRRVYSWGWCVVDAGAAWPRGWVEGRARAHRGRAVSCAGDGCTALDPSPSPPLDLPNQPSFPPLLCTRAHVPVRRGDFGRLGHGDCSDVFVPQEIAFFNSMVVRQVACGDTHTLVCTDAGELFTFGRNQNGQLGLGDTADVLAPRRVADLAGVRVTGVAGGAEHSVVSTADGEVHAFGWGRYGNLGDGEQGE